MPLETPHAASSANLHPQYFEIACSKGAQQQQMRTGAGILLLCACICPVGFMIPDSQLAVPVSISVMQSKWDCLTREVCMQLGRAVHMCTAPAPEECAADLCCAKWQLGLPHIPEAGILIIATGRHHVLTVL